MNQARGSRKRGDYLKTASRLLLILSIFLLLPLRFVSVSAEGSDEFTLDALDTSSFPEIQFFLDAFEVDGNAVPLSEDNVRVIENGQRIEPVSVKWVEHGLQTIIALNPSPAMAVEKDGSSFYQHLQMALQDWAGSRPSEAQDDFSLATPTGLYLIRTQDPDQLVNALATYEPDFSNSQVTLTSLAEALDLATDPLDSPQKKRAILYITPPVSTNQVTNLEDLASRARQIGVRVNVWMAAPENEANADAQAALQQLAERTGGKFAHILPDAAIPDVESVFETQRGAYQVTYLSSIRKGGDHSLRAEIILGDGKQVSSPREFTLDVQPPKPFFLSPPGTVQRSWTVPEKKNPPSLTPAAVDLEIQVEFPDKLPRALKATRLFVDGELAVENTAEPFNTFHWDISGLDTTSRHLLQIEVVDEIGMTGTSLEMPIEIVVEQPAKASLTGSLSSSGIIAVASASAAAGALALILVLTGSRRWARRKRQPGGMRAREKDPVTQPVAVKQEPPRAQKRTGSSFLKNAFGITSAPWSGSSRTSTTWPRPAAVSAPARLVALDENEQPITGGTILLSRQEITFGSDPRRATQLLESPTVDGLHARLYRDQDDVFFLADQGSVAGTWVNYAPISTGGARLEHGDLIHIGRVTFRFELTDPSRVKPFEIQVVELEK